MTRLPSLLIYDIARRAILRLMLGASLILIASVTLFAQIVIG